MNPQRAPALPITAAEEARLLASEQEGWRYATEVQQQLGGVRSELALAKKQIESLELTQTRYMAVMEAYGKSREPHTAPTAHDAAGCTACEGRRRLDALFAAYRAAQETVVAVPA